MRVILMFLEELWGLSVWESTHVKCLVQCIPHCMYSMFSYYWHTGINALTPYAESQVPWDSMFPGSSLEHMLQSA